MRQVATLVVAYAVFACSAMAADQKAYSDCVSTATSGKATADQAIGACRGPADEGNTGAMYVIGSLLLKSRVAAERNEGVAWLTKAAGAGHAEAAYELAKAYLADGSQASHEDGVKWLRFAACSGYPRAVSLATEKGIPTSVAECPARQLSDFAGTTWTGLLRAAKGDDAERRLRLTFADGGVHVFTVIDANWKEVKSGKFTVTQKDASVVVSVIDSGWDLDGEWIETWTIVLMRLSNTDAYATFTRTVNNPNLPMTSDWRSFTSFAEGHVSRDTTR